MRWLGLIEQPRGPTWGLQLPRSSKCWLNEENDRASDIKEKIRDVIAKRDEARRQL